MCIYIYIYIHVYIYIYIYIHITVNNNNNIIRYNVILYDLTLVRNRIWA